MRGMEVKVDGKWTPLNGEQTKSGDVCRVFDLDDMPVVWPDGKTEYTVGDSFNPCGMSKEDFRNRLHVMVIGSHLHALVHKLEPDNAVSYARTMAAISSVAADGLKHALDAIAAGEDAAR